MANLLKTKLEDIQASFENEDITALEALVLMPQNFLLKDGIKSISSNAAKEKECLKRTEHKFLSGSI